MIRPLTAILLISVTVILWSCGFRFERNKTFYERAERQNVENAHLLFMRGKIELAEGNCGIAERYFDRALRVKPDLVEAYVGLGHSLREQGKTKKAVETYKKALQLDPQSSAAHEGLGNCYYAQNRRNKAREHFLHALQLNPNSAKCLEQLGNIAYVETNYALALDYWQKALERSPDNSQLRALYEDLRQYVSIYGEDKK